MKKLLLVSLLLGSQINYASNRNQYDSAKVQRYAAMYGIGFIMVISGVCISGNAMNGLIKDPKNDSQGPSSVVGATLVAAGGGIMGYSFAKLAEASQNKNFENCKSQVCMSGRKQNNINKFHHHQD